MRNNSCIIDCYDVIFANFENNVKFVKFDNFDVFIKYACNGVKSSPKVVGNYPNASARKIKTHKQKNDRIKSCGHFGVQAEIPGQKFMTIQPSIK